MLTAEKTAAAIVHLESFKAIVGASNLSIEKEVLHHYASDETEDLHFLPDVVIKPGSAAEISGILKICNQYKIPVTPRGAGTGLSGGALPHLGGVLLSIERLNRIIEIDKRNGGATVQVNAGRREVGIIHSNLHIEIADIRPAQQGASG